MPRKHALVTGAAGFIGSHLVRRLRADGHPVVGVDAFRGVTTPAIAALRLAELRDDPGFDLVELDLTGDDLHRLVAQVRPQVIFHLAARPGARDADADALHRDNVQATACVVAAADADAVPDLVFTSSSSVYGEAGVRGPCHEGDSVEPLSPYGEAKRAAELLCLEATARTTILRLFTVYGPGQRPDMAFARFITSSLSGLSAPLYQRCHVSRDFTYVADAVEGIMLGLEARTGADLQPLRGRRRGARSRVPDHRGAHRRRAHNACGRLAPAAIDDEGGPVARTVASRISTACGIACRTD